MSQTTAEEIKAFQEFLAANQKTGPVTTTLEEALAEFREYRRQLHDLKAKIREAEESSARGESRPLDIDDVIARGENRLAEKGIVD